MPRVTVNVRADMFRQLQIIAKGNGRGVTTEICHRLGWSLTKAMRARAAKIAVVSGNRKEALAHAKAHFYRRDQWFYAGSVETATGRYVLKVELVGSFQRRKDLTALLRELRGAELAALIDCR